MTHRHVTISFQGTLNDWRRVMTYFIVGRFFFSFSFLSTERFSSDVNGPLTSRGNIGRGEEDTGVVVVGASCTTEHAVNL